ncbi:hypothetical protein HNP84_001835 [Thermocatellispora tengchongensis]|uniref:CPBP family intramembrane metalloprotease n=1 Tax=Thermocatellispora tengchongensis TaxID=1073253 RepID=A0A840NY57_9ACTN|nr:hypothetical protein [Thermocatellispora tengchongensis]MBB5132122.1 hypothetical protein [Thermocatellispora tengchongensis]
MPRPGFAVSCSLLPFGFGLSVVLVLLLEWLAPDVIPYELATFWPVGGEPWPAFTDSLRLAWPVLAVGLLLSLLVLPRARRVQRELAWYGSGEGRVITLGPGSMLVWSTVEEIVFRWLLFYAAIAGAVFMDYIVLGFAGLHPVRWVFTEVLIPLADLATGRQLHEILIGMPWIVAAAILTSNGRFRNGHGYQGILGWIWSWYMGMFLFLIMFEHGLPLAIAVHVVYNLTTLLLHLAVVGTLPRLVVPG